MFFLLNTDFTDFTDSLVCIRPLMFLLNTDYTDITDSLVLSHNGTKASSLDVLQ